MSNPIEANEAIDRFCDSISRASSVCKELSSIQANREWLLVSKFLEQMRTRGKELSQKRGLSKDELSQMIDKRLKKLGNDNNG